MLVFLYYRGNTTEQEMSEFKNFPENENKKGKKSIEDEKDTD